MTTDFPLTVFYDGSCPVCLFEMELLGRRDDGQRLHLVDLSAAAFDAGVHGFSRHELDAVIHAVRPDGSVLRGMAVLRLCYVAAGLGWLSRSSASPLLRPIFDAGYRLFARHRHSVSRAIGPVFTLLRERRLRKTVGRMEACTSDRSCATATPRADRRRRS